MTLLEAETGASQNLKIKGMQGEAFRNINRDFWHH